MTRTEVIEMVTRAGQRALDEGPLEAGDYFTIGAMIYDLARLVHKQASATEIFKTADELLVKVVRMVIERTPPA